MPLKPKRERYEQIRQQAWSDRSSFDSHWRELGDFLLPRRTRFWVSDRNRGDRRNQNIIDSTARFAARTLASGLHAGLTSPARPWMRLTTPDPDLADFAPVKEWLHVLTQRMLTVFQQSNLYQALPIVYGDMGVFGTAAVAIMDDTLDTFRCYPKPIGSYALGLDARGVATMFVHDYELTVRQVVEEFGLAFNRRDIDWSHISASVKEQWDEGNYETAVPVTWIVLPNEGYRADRIESRYLPWSSCTYERNEEAPAGGRKKFLRERGFATFPVLCPRWDVTSAEDCYGTDCPGMTALGDVKQLQIMQKEKGKAIAKQVNPPLVGPTSLRTQHTSLLPGDVTYVDVREGMQGLKTVHDVNINLADLTADIRETQYRIQRAFYEDLFLMLARSDPMRGSQPATAREIEERHEEKLLALGPVLERTNDELLDPLVDRVYHLMETRHLVPAPPQEIQGVTLKVEYISILAQAQKLVGVTGQDRFVQTAMGMVEVFPTVRHKLDVDQLVDNYAEMLGVDPRIVRPTDEAQALAASEAKQAQQMAQAEQAKTEAQAMQAAAAAPMEGDTALSRMAPQLAQMGGPPASPLAPAVPGGL